MEKCILGKLRAMIHIKDGKVTVKIIKEEKWKKRPLYDAMSKYGVQNFTFEPIEQIENSEELCKREVYYIDKLQTYVGFDDCNGYNATLGGDEKARSR